MPPILSSLYLSIQPLRIPQTGPIHPFWFIDRIVNLIEEELNQICRDVVVGVLDQRHGSPSQKAIHGNIGERFGAHGEETPIRIHVVVNTDLGFWKTETKRILNRFPNLNLMFKSKWTKSALKENF